MKIVPFPVLMLLGIFASPVSGSVEEACRGLAEITLIAEKYRRGGAARERAISDLDLLVMSNDHRQIIIQTIDLVYRIPDAHFQSKPDGYFGREEERLCIEHHQKMNSGRSGVD